jgi:pimeloyl-ACP methyl ester carboxylesterase
MPKIRVNGAQLYYEDSGGVGKPVILFSHGLLFSCRMFDAQVEAFKAQYRCIAYDHRGQGQSEVTSGGYDMENLYQDAVSLIEALGIAPCHFVGVSMGGFMGMRLAARRPDLIRSLVLLETSPDPEPEENRGKYRLMALVFRYLGAGLVANRVMRIMFGKAFVEDPARAAERVLWKERISSGNRKGIYESVMSVVNRNSIYEEIDRITAPTLVMVGDSDVATVRTKSERIQAKIPASKMVIIPKAGHSSPIEEPTFVNQHIRDFLATVP